MNILRHRNINTMRTEEPQEYHSKTEIFETEVSETRLRDNDTEMAESSLDSWDRDTWAENIIRQ